MGHEFAGIVEELGRESPGNIAVGEEFSVLEVGNKFESAFD